MKKTRCNPLLIGGNWGCGLGLPLGVPEYRLAKTKPSTDHRRYNKITTAATATAYNINFGLQTAQRVLLDALTDGGKRSVMCSPVSITAVLNILAACATGSMLEQLLTFLGCDDVEQVTAAAARFMEVLKGSDDEDGPDIAFANAFEVAQRTPIKATLVEVLRDVHKVEVRNVDFENQPDQVVKEANLWVEEETKGMIKQILSRDAISKETMMILVNALYFKGVWVDTFKRKHTKDKDFHLLNGDKIQAPFMTQWHTKFDYGTFEDCKVLRMLYREGDEPVKGKRKKSFSMYIFLPNEKDGLSNLMKNVKIDANMFKDRIRMEYVKIYELSIPKFSFECEFSLTEPMKKLGLTSPFSMDCKDLLGMVESSNNSGDWPYINNVFQKCTIEVNEKGTKAAALTRVHMMVGAEMPPPPIYFVADHPFMFMIREDFSGAILFVGTVLDPCST